MKKIYIVIVSLMLGIVGLMIYINTDQYISKFAWKYDGGAYVGDFLIFNEKSGFELRGRKILNNGKPIATIIICIDKYLIVRSDGKTGYYAPKKL